MRKRRKKDTTAVERELAKHDSQIIDLATRLVRLEAEVGIYRPLFTDEEKGSE